MERVRPVSSLKIFSINDEPSPYFLLHYTLEIDLTKIPFDHTNGSLGLLPARLLGLTWAEYLRFCRDILGATIVGRGKRYPAIYFQRSAEIDTFIKLLNTRASMAIAERQLKEKGELDYELEDFKENSI